MCAAAGLGGKAAQERGAESASDFVTDRVTHHRADHHEDTDGYQRDMVKRGKDASEDDGCLSGQHEPQEEAGLAEAQATYDEVRQPSVEAEHPVEQGAHVTPG